MGIINRKTVSNRTLLLSVKAPTKKFTGYMGKRKRTSSQKAIANNKNGKNGSRISILFVFTI